MRLWQDCIPFFLIYNPRVLFFNFVFIQKSQYIRPKGTVHKCAVIIRTGVSFERALYEKILYTIVYDRKRIYGLFQIANSELKIKGATLAGGNQNYNMLKQEL